MLKFLQDKKINALIQAASTFLLVTFSTTYVAADVAWQAQGEQWLEQRLAHFEQAEKNQTAKNIVLFLGDGMSITTLTGARILAGQQQGKSGEENFLSFEHFSSSALIKTYNVNQQTPDSAGTMSAIMTGVKTRAGVVSLGPEQQRAKCAGEDQHQLETLLEWGKKQGYATGVVTTARVTHATPAATYAHSAERNWEVDSWKYPQAHWNGCVDIAEQLLSTGFDNAVDIVLGGGERNFMPWYQGGYRISSILPAWQVKYPQHQLLNNKQQLMKLAAQKDAHPVLGLFAKSHMAFHDQRNDQQPSLQEMTEQALIYLKNRSQQGYILIVEGARIDHAHHKTSAARALQETIDMAETVALVDKLTSDQETLLVVTADHSHTLSMAGYPKRGNAILGLVRNQKDELVLALDNKPYTTLGYANGQGPDDLSNERERHAGRLHHAIDDQQVQSITAKQEVLVPLDNETHASDDVALHAKGPGAQKFSGLLEQNTIYHILKNALLKTNELKAADNSKLEAATGAAQP